MPTERARSLVAYLLSLNNAYDYPEARPFAVAAAAGHGAAEKHDAKAAAPAAGHAEKKEGEKK